MINSNDQSEHNAPSCRKSCFCAKHFSFVDCSVFRMASREGKSIFYIVSIWFRSRTKRQITHLRQCSDTGAQGFFLSRKQVFWLSKIHLSSFHHHCRVFNGNVDKPIGTYEPNARNICHLMIFLFYSSDFHFTLHLMARMRFFSLLLEQK